MFKMDCVLLILQKNRINDINFLMSICENVWVPFPTNISQPGTDKSMFLCWSPFGPSCVWILSLIVEGKKICCSHCWRKRSVSYEPKIVASVLPSNPHIKPWARQADHTLQMGKLSWERSWNRSKSHDLQPSHTAYAQPKADRGIQMSAGTNAKGSH